MPIRYLFADAVAVNPADGSLVSNATFKVYAKGDTAFATPLQAYDLTGSPTTVRSGPWGALLSFQVDDQPQVVLVDDASGLPTVVKSFDGLMALAAAAQAAAENAAAQVEDLANAPSVLPAGGSTGDVLTRGSSEHSGVWAPPASGGGAAATWGTLPGKPSTFPPSAHSHMLTDIDDASTIGKAIMKAADAPAVRTAIGAAPSTVVSFPGFGTSGTTAAPGNHQHSASQIPFTPSGSITATDVQAAIGQAAASGGGTGTADPNAYFVRDYTSGAWPVRGRTDGVCRWRGPASAGAPPNGGNYAKAGVDERGVTSS